MKNSWLTTERFLLAFIIGMNLFRLSFVPIMGLMPQGAYYFVYSEHIDWSYYDHPPMVAYLLALFSGIFGKAAWVVKLMSWSMALGSQLLFYKLARLFMERKAALLALAIYTSTIMLSVLSLVVTPDVPLIFFWTLSLLVLYRAVFLDKKWAWIVGGVCMGLAFDSKYTAVFLPACLGVFLLLSSRHRYRLLTIWPWLAGIVMIITMLPVIYWNIVHDFASFGFQGANRVEIIAEEGWKPTHILGSIANQSVVLIPVLFITFITKLPMELYRRFRSIMADDKTLFVLSFFIPVFGAFMGLSFIYWVKLNWIMPAYVMGCIYAVRLLTGPWLKWQFILSVVLHLALGIQVWFYPVPIKSDDTWYGWERLAEEVEDISEDHNAFIFAGDHYKTTAQLAFYIDEKIYAHNVIGRHAVQYDIIDTSFTHLIGEDAIFVDSDPTMRSVPGQTRYPEELDEHFTEVTELDLIKIRKGERVVRVFRVFLCEGYMGLLPEDKRELY
ncbi:MAG: glycosyltransferase family 39 protein [Saprospiraceae bacterium]|nr:glycosyltransferase family 39 protein [Saprospiraceae bacterium]